MERFSEIYENKSMTGKCVRDAAFSDCDFKNCKFAETQFSLCRFEDVRFSGCAFVNVKFAHSLMFSSAFENCALVNFNFSSLCRGYGGAKLSAPFSKAAGCVFKYVSFVGFDLKKPIFPARNLSNAILTAAI